MSPDNILIIFVKYPQAGFVKTRLSKTIGKQSAALLYKLFVETIIATTKDIFFKRIIFFTPPSKRKEFVKWLGKDLEFFPQRGNNLGRKMSNAFKEVFKHGAKRVAIIGTDSPLIDNRIIRKAFSILETKRCVVGPSLDGGYYLLGLSGFYRQIFEGIDWGTDRVFRQTLNSIKKLSIKYSILGKHFDVDDMEGLDRLNKRLKKKLPK